MNMLELAGRLQLIEAHVMRARAWCLIVLATKAPVTELNSLVEAQSLISGVLEAVITPLPEPTAEYALAWPEPTPDSPTEGDILD